MKERAHFSIVCSVYPLLRSGCLVDGETERGLVSELLGQGELMQNELVVGVRDWES
jgi:hypothetical protein